MSCAVSVTLKSTNYYGMYNPKKELIETLKLKINAQNKQIKEMVGALSEIMESNRQTINLMEQAWQEGAISDEKPPEAFMGDDGYIRVK